MLVGEEVKEGEEHGEWLLHAQKAVERPFSVELDDGLKFGDPVVGYDVLAGIVAFGGAVPEEESVEESWQC